MVRLRPNLLTMVSRWARIQDVLKVKVKVKGHVIQALMWCPENCFFSRELAGLRPNLHTMVSRWACIQGVLKVKVTGTWLIWVHENRFFFHANGCILTKLSISVTFPSLFRFIFFRFPIPKWLWVRSVSSTIAHSSHTGSETVCQQFVKLFAIQYGLTFCLYMRSLYEASLRPILSFKTKYQAARKKRLTTYIFRVHICIIFTCMWRFAACRGWGSTNCTNDQ